MFYDVQWHSLVGCVGCGCVILIYIFRRSKDRQRKSVYGETGLWQLGFYVNAIVLLMLMLMQLFCWQCANCFLDSWYVNAIHKFGFVEILPIANCFVEIVDILVQSTNCCSDSLYVNEIGSYGKDINLFNPTTVKKINFPFTSRRDFCGYLCDIYFRKKTYEEIVCGCPTVIAL